MANSAQVHQDHSLFGLFGKKDEHQQQKHGNVVEHHGNLPPSYHQETVPAVSLHATEDFHSSHEESPKHGQGNEGGGGIMSKLHRSDSSSSSNKSNSSDEEEEDGKKKKEGLKKEMKKKLPGGHESEEQHHHAGEGEKKQGFIDKIKEKLPVYKKKDEED